MWIWKIAPPAKPPPPPLPFPNPNLTLTSYLSQNVGLGGGEKVGRNGSRRVRVSRNPRRLLFFLENFARLWFPLRILLLNWDFPMSVIWDISLISISNIWQTKQKKAEYGRVLFTRAFQEHLVNRTWVWHLTFVQQPIKIHCTLCIPAVIGL